MEDREAFVGIVVAKLSDAVAVADGVRGGEMRSLGELDASRASMIRLVKRVAAKYDRVQFCYAAGPDRIARTNWIAAFWRRKGGREFTLKTDTVPSPFRTAARRPCRSRSKPHRTRRPARGRAAAARAGPRSSGPARPQTARAAKPRPIP